MRYRVIQLKSIEVDLHNILVSVFPGVNFMQSQYISLEQPVTLQSEAAAVQVL